jgi:hypothetical protein
MHVLQVRYGNGASHTPESSSWQHRQRTAAAFAARIDATAHQSAERGARLFPESGERLFDYGAGA